MGAMNKNSYFVTATLSEATLLQRFEEALSYLEDLKQVEDIWRIFSMKKMAQITAELPPDRFWLKELKYGLWKHVSDQLINATWPDHNFRQFLESFCEFVLRHSEWYYFAAPILGR